MEREPERRVHKRQEAMAASGSGDDFTYILSAFFVHLLCAYSRVCNFYWQKDICGKATLKMLVKLTTAVVNFTNSLSSFSARKFFGQFFLLTLCNLFTAIEN